MEYFSPETTELQQPTSEIISPESLFQLIYQNQSLPVDSRLNDPSEGGVFRYFQPGELLNPLHFENQIYAITKNHNQITGVAQLEKSPHENSVAWIKYVEVDPAHQNHGLGTKLLHAIFKYAKDHNLTLETSQYTAEGLTKLAPTITKLSQEYQVPVVQK